MYDKEWIGLQYIIKPLKQVKGVLPKSDSFPTALNRLFVGPDPNFVVYLMSL